MSRNHEKLYVFHQSHKLTRAIFSIRGTFHATNGLVCGRRCVALRSPYRAIWWKEVHEAANVTI